jgi:hypothetical protein
VIGLGGVAQVAERLLYKPEVLSSNPSSRKKEKMQNKIIGDYFVGLFVTQRNSKSSDMNCFLEIRTYNIKCGKSLKFYT